MCAICKKDLLCYTFCMQTATFAGGCFWCTEAIFKRLKGVEGVVSGYSGGKRENPTYEQVSTGATGHAEAIQVEFDPEIIPYKKLLEIFFHLHDPTTLDRQGADIGTQYRSIIFYHNEDQKKEAHFVMSEISSSGIYKDPIVTKIIPFENFYPAEKHHQNYYENNLSQGYCTYVISPKLQKLMRGYSKEVKDEYKNK